MSKAPVRIGPLEVSNDWACRDCGAGPFPWYTTASADHSIHTPVAFPRQNALRGDGYGYGYRYEALRGDGYRYFPAQAGDIIIPRVGEYTEPEHWATYGGPRDVRGAMRDVAQAIEATDGVH